MELSMLKVKVSEAAEDRALPFDNAGLRAGLSGLQVEGRSIHEELREAIDQRLELEASTPRKGRRGSSSK